MECTITIDTFEAEIGVSLRSWFNSVLEEIPNGSLLKDHVTDTKMMSLFSLVFMETDNVMATRWVNDYIDEHGLIASKGIDLTLDVTIRGFLRVQYLKTVSVFHRLRQLGLIKCSDEPSCHHSYAEILATMSLHCFDRDQLSYYTIPDDIHGDISYLAEYTSDELMCSLSIYSNGGLGGFSALFSWQQLMQCEGCGVVNDNDGLYLCFNGKRYRMFQCPLTGSPMYIQDVRQFAEDFYCLFGAELSIVPGSFEQFLVSNYIMEAYKFDYCSREIWSFKASKRNHYIGLFAAKGFTKFRADVADYLNIARLVFKPPINFCSVQHTLEFIHALVDNAFKTNHFKLPAFDYFSLVEKLMFKEMRSVDYDVSRCDADVDKYGGVNLFVDDEDMDEYSWDKDIVVGQRSMTSNVAKFNVTDSRDFDIPHKFAMDVCSFTGCPGVVVESPDPVADYSIVDDIYGVAMTELADITSYNSPLIITDLAFVGCSFNDIDDPDGLLVDRYTEDNQLYNDRGSVEWDSTESLPIAKCVLDTQLPPKYINHIWVDNKVFEVINNPDVRVCVLRLSVACSDYSVRHRYPCGVERLLDHFSRVRLFVGSGLLTTDFYVSCSGRGIMLSPAEKDICLAQMNTFFKAKYYCYNYARSWYRFMHVCGYRMPLSVYDKHARIYMFVGSDLFKRLKLIGWSFVRPRVRLRFKELIKRYLGKVRLRMTSNKMTLTKFKGRASWYV